MVETKWDTFTLDILLTHTGHDLRDVEVRALRPSCDHGFESVPQKEIIEGSLTSIITSPIESPVDLKLETVNHVLAWLSFEVSGLSFMQDLFDFFVLLLQILFDSVKGLFLGDNVLDAYGKSVLVKPIVDQKLGV